MEIRKSPYKAAWAGILIPGLGHWYAGSQKSAAVAFSVVTALFGLGCVLAGHRVFAFTGHPFATTPLLQWIPIHVWPEVGNLGETMLLWLGQPELDPDRSRLLRLPIQTEHLGLALTGLSGGLNFMLAADACWLVGRQNLSAERGRSIGGRPAFSVILAWLVPGLGHVREGRKATGIMIAAALCLLYALGLGFSELNGVDRPQLYWLWAAQTGMGGATLAASVLLGPLEISHRIETMDLGTTMLAICGLLNIVVLTDVYTLGETRALTEAGICIQTEPEPSGRGAVEE
ncbi:MAG: DUF6677 family protein [Planctomycetota bacterium]